MLILLNNLGGKHNNVLSDVLKSGAKVVMPYAVQLWKDEVALIFSRFSASILALA